MSMPNETKHTQWMVTDQAPIDGLNLQGLKSVCIKRGETYVTVAEIISADDAELIARAPTLLAENETLRQQNAELVRALQAIEARIHGDYDDPLLLAYGPLGTLSGDCSHIARAALAQVQS